jgi:DNA ligase-associated metallophosphoesterase
MTAAPLHIAGERLMLDPAGALHWPGQRILVVSDLHFEKGTSAAIRGSLLPPYDTRETLVLLAHLIRKYGPRTVVCLGDTFHDAKGGSRLQTLDMARLTHLTTEADFVWVLGNHDPLPPEGLSGIAVDEYKTGPLVFRHQALAGRVMGEISGHFHPKATVPVRGTQVCRPCFIADGYRMMLPAIGAYTGGLDVRDAAIGVHFPRGGRVFLLGRERLYSFPIAPSRPGAGTRRDHPEPVLTRS